MDTNYHMLKELLEVYKPKETGIVYMNEIYLINEKLCLDKMDVLQLRNLRDFVVLYFGRKTHEDFDMVEWDKMSAITTVIDTKICNKGGTV